MKLGIIGSGMIVDTLLTFIHELPSIELIHISGTKRSEEKVKKIYEEHHFQRYSTDYEDLLNDEQVDTIYVAVPNHLHYDYSKRALKHHKHVILEKPLTSTYQEALKLQRLAMDNHLFLWEAITNQYLPNFHKVKELLKDIGQIKIVECNYSQYSSRYDAFKRGEILPAFDYRKSGGALMDLNIYNIHFVVGLFGRPKDIHYYPNIENHIDTSGILILEYEAFQCVCIGAKDCKAPLSNRIQGDRGCLHIESPLSLIGSIEWLKNDGQRLTIDVNQKVHRMYDEFAAFAAMLEKQDYKQCYEMLEHSVLVSEVQTIARQKSGIVFLADQELAED